MEKVHARRRRVVVTGAESTGKSTVAAAVADAFDVTFLPEYLRAFVNIHNRLPNAADTSLIAMGHLAQVSASTSVNTSGPIELLDTDLLSTICYHRYYFGECPDWIEQKAKEELADLYLFCNSDIPYEAEPGMRDSVEARAAIDRALRGILAEYDAKTVELKGSLEDRLETALTAINDCLTTVR